MPVAGQLAAFPIAILFRPAILVPVQDALKPIEIPCVAVAPVPNATELSVPDVPVALEPCPMLTPVFALAVLPMAMSFVIAAVELSPIATADVALAAMLAVRPIAIPSVALAFTIVLVPITTAFVAVLTQLAESPMHIPPVAGHEAALPIASAFEFAALVPVEDALNPMEIPCVAVAPVPNATELSVPDEPIALEPCPILTPVFALAVFPIAMSFVIAAVELSPIAMADVALAVTLAL
jgi:hypothetical protein